MKQQLSLDGYAQSLGINSEDLRAVFTSQVTHLDTALLDQLADLYKQSREALREQSWGAPPPESFAAWLKRNMEGVSQHALRTRVQLDAKTLRRFLNAELLPDSDLAERISRALYIDRMEIARVVSADMVQQADAGRLVSAASVAAAHRTASPAASAASARVRSQRTRRPNTLLDNAPATLESATPPEPVVAEQAVEDVQPGSAAARRQADPTSVDAASEQPSTPDAASLGNPAQRRAGVKKSSTQAAHSTPASAIDDTSAASAISVERPKPARVRGTSTRTAAVSPMTATAETPAHTAPAPAAEVEQRPPSTARRQSGTIAAASRTTTTARIGGAPVQQDEPAPPAASEPIPALNALDQPTSRKQRRARAVRSAADTPPPTMSAAAEDSPASPAEADVAPAAEAPLPAAPAPTVSAKSTGPATEIDAPLPRASRLSLTDQRVPTSDATAAPAPASAMVAPVLAADATTLLLTPDEARLIRHWRQLHPHGRRATLHYIGSLLVDE
jgi:hypothetical protein